MVGVRVMDGHSDHKGARADKDQKGGPRGDYSTIRGTLCHVST